MPADAPRIRVLSPMDPSRPTANSIADLRMCAGLAAEGHEVELVVPSSNGARPPVADLLDIYGLEPRFGVRYVRGARLGPEQHRRTILRLVANEARALTRPSRAAVMISRDARLLLPHVAASRLPGARVTVAPWLHEFRDIRRERLVYGRASVILATNSAIIAALKARGIRVGRSFVTGNPVPAERLEFGRTVAREEARRQISIDDDRPLVVYTGKLHRGLTEGRYLIEAATRLPQYLFLFTGGRPAEIAAITDDLRSRAVNNVRLTGFLPRPEDTRFYQQAADVLVAYYSLKDHVHADHNLPNKLAEYMTTGNPIVVADFKAARDLVDERNGFPVAPDDVDALVAAIEHVIGDPEDARRRGARAQEDAARQTTETLGKGLSSFLAEIAER